MVWAVVTGGGTSGHVIPAIAVIEMLEDSGVPTGEIAYVGSRRGVESRMIPATGVRSAYLPISGLQRSMSPRGILRNVALPWRLVRSTLMARSLIRRWDPAVVVSVGGYASEPMARAAVARGVPLVCVSYDFVPGLATRRQSRHATVCTVAFEGSELPRAVVTGAPVRRSVRTMDRGAMRGTCRAALGVEPEEILVTVVGGSLGSFALNNSVASVTAALSAAGIRARVRHVTGPRYGFTGAQTGADGVVVDAVAYEDDMPGLLAASDVLVSRAGASTVAEIATLGVASVLVPWPGAADNHQARNAEWLARGGGAVVVEESAGLAGDLAGAVVELALDPQRRAAIGTAARELGARNRSGALVDAIRNAALR